MKYRAKTPNVQFEIIDLPRFDQQVPGGLDSIPHLTFKTVQRPQGIFTWWGIHIRNVFDAPWTEENVSMIKRRILAITGQMPKGTTLCAEHDRIVSNILDVATRRKRPVIYGGNNNDILQTQLVNGIQFDVFHEHSEDLLNYGGYPGTVEMLGSSYRCMLYHRGISLPNYMDSALAKQVVEEQLPERFPLIFKAGSVKFNPMASVTRKRMKNNDVERRSRDR